MSASACTRSMPGWHFKNDDGDDDDDLQSCNETHRRQQSPTSSQQALRRRSGSTHLAESRPSSGAAGRAENSSTTTAADVSGAASASWMISRYECFWKDGECFVGVLAVTAPQPCIGQLYVRSIKHSTVSRHF